MRSGIRPGVGLPRRPAALLLLGMLGAALTLTASPAAAHPFGPPPTALLRVEGDLVLVDWRSAPDDAAAIGVQLGYMDPSVLDAYLEAPTQVAPSAADEDALAAAPELDAYIRERIVVRQDGTPCDVESVDTADFVHAGARIALRCPEPIEAVEVELAMLHDVNEAYRTFGLTESETAIPAQAAFTTAEPRHVIDFTGATAAEAEAEDETAEEGDGGDGGGRTPAVLALLGVLGVGALGGILLARRGG